MWIHWGEKDCFVACPAADQSGHWSSSDLKQHYSSTIRPQKKKVVESPGLRHFWRIPRSRPRDLSNCENRPHFFTLLSCESKPYKGFWDQATHIANQMWYRREGFCETKEPPLRKKKYQVRLLQLTTYHWDFDRNQGDFEIGLYFRWTKSATMSGMGLSLTELCCLFCCPPCPSKIAAKLAFLPPEPTYSFEDEDASGTKQKLVLFDKAEWQYSEREKASTSV